VAQLTFASPSEGDDVILLERYVGAQVVWGITVVLTVLVGLDALSAVIDELQGLRGNYGFYDALFYVATSLPGRVVELAPIAVLVGVLVALGQLASTSELVVIRSSGVSQRGVLKILLKPVLVLAGVLLIVGEFVVPKVEQLGETERALALSDNGNVTGRYGMWYREGQHFIHFNAVQSAGVIYGITLFTFDDAWTLSEEIRARRGTFQDSGWLLEEVERTQINSWGTEASRHTTLLWETDVTPDLLAMESVSPDRASINNLLKYSAYLHQQGLEAADYEVAAWKKITQPLAIMMLVLVATGFIFGPLRDGTLGLRVFIGTLVGLAFKISQDLVISITLVYGITPWLAVLLPLAVGAAAGVYLLKRGS